MLARFFVGHIVRVAEQGSVERKLNQLAYVEATLRLFIVEVVQQDIGCLQELERNLFERGVLENQNEPALDVAVHEVSEYFSLKQASIVLFTVH